MLTMLPVYAETGVGVTRRDPDSEAIQGVGWRTASLLAAALLAAVTVVLERALLDAETADLKLGAGP